MLKSTFIPPVTFCRWLQCRQMRLCRTCGNLKVFIWMYQWSLSTGSTFLYVYTFCPFLMRGLHEVQRQTAWGLVPIPQNAHTPSKHTCSRLYMLHPSSVITNYVDMMKTGQHLYFPEHLRQNDQTFFSAQTLTVIMSLDHEDNNGCYLHTVILGHFFD